MIGRCALLGLVLASIAGCASSTGVTEGDIKALESKHSEQAYEDAMKKAGRGDELAEQQRIAAEREQAGR